MHGDDSESPWPAGRWLGPYETRFDVLSLFLHPVICVRTHVNVWHTLERCDTRLPANFFTVADLPPVAPAQAHTEFA